MQPNASYVTHETFFGGSMEPKLAARLGAVARQARTRAGLTQADVAERVGIAPEVYGRLERGRMLPSVETLLRLCRALSLSADELLGLVDAAPAQAAEPPIAYGLSPELRRLRRRLGKLTPKQLRLLGLLASELARSPRET